jgi:ribosomal protein S18 acetylase RimI-like enzyme
VDEQRVSALAEHIEAESMAAMFDIASEPVHRALGLEYVRVGGGVAAVSTSEAMQQYWSRAVGFGWSEPITDDVVEQVCELHRRHGCRVVRFQVSPWVPGEWETTLERHGFTPDATCSKFVRDTSPSPEAFTTLKVRPLTRADGERYAAVYCEGFGIGHADHALDQSVREWLVDQTERDSWSVFGAFDGESMVACAAMYLTGDSAELLGATTLPNARRRGAQTALLAERLRAAARRGVRWVSTEVSAASDGERVSSIRNLRRLGFVELYERRNWVADLTDPGEGCS